MAMEAPPHHEGFIRKSHADKPYLKANVRRWLVAKGFNMTYYAERDCKKLKGHFDLRNVVRISPASDGVDEDQAIDWNGDGL